MDAAAAGGLLLVCSKSALPGWGVFLTLNCKSPFHSRAATRLAGWLVVLACEVI